MEITGLRAEIDAVDAEIVRLFQNRMEIAEKIARCKMEADLPVADTDRERELIRRRREWADGDMRIYVEKLFETILVLSKDYQRLIMAKNSRNAEDV